MISAMSMAQYTLTANPIGPYAGSSITVSQVTDGSQYNATSPYTTIYRPTVALVNTSSTFSGSFSNAKWITFNGSSGPLGRGTVNFYPSVVLTLTYLGTVAPPSRIQLVLSNRTGHESVSLSSSNPDDIVEEVMTGIGVANTPGLSTIDGSASNTPFTAVAQGSYTYSGGYYYQSYTATVPLLIMEGFNEISSGATGNILMSQSYSGLTTSLLNWN